MKKLLTILFCALTLSMYAQTNAQIGKDPAGVQVVKTKHSITIAGKVINYTATTGYMHMKADTGKVLAKIFFTYYAKDDEDGAKRPVTFTFNGGPGSASLWLHMGGVGPKRVVLKDDGTATAAPYSYIPNEFSWLDKTDLVFIDPVSTGYSRAVGESASKYHGYVEDIKSVGDFVRNFLSRYDRWASPKFLAGESYGTTRAAGLSKFLQDEHRIYINGVILISAVLNFGTNDYNIGNDLPRALYIPSYTAAAWYHKKLAPALQARPIADVLKESEQWAIGPYATALIKGGWMSDAEKTAIAEKMAYYTGLSKELCLQANLRLDENRFYKALRRADGLSIGRLDARFTGRNLDDAGEYVDFDPSFTNIDGPFTATINDYLSKELKFTEEKGYNVFGEVYPWSYKNVQNKYLNVAESLRDAMAKNPNLKVYLGCGYYDFATPYFTAVYDIEHMFLRPEQRSRVDIKYYESGHMYYIHKPSLIQFKKDIDSFFDSSK
ncbi:S10 family peptidase [Aquirufa antheringensis]|uniref:S10 family peptidase n=1 Tax=Aquirufa antheringensis TaxID=2516559 RepID=UPI00191C509C|nr:peptidase S10 [Aquirufa antheringensis]MCL9968083.1 peptidase S10 [Aquirufa antheringensis]